MQFSRTADGCGGAAGEATATCYKCGMGGRQRRSLTVPFGVVTLVFGLLASACDDSSATGRPCESYTDCPSDHTCVYEIAKGCAATPTCQPRPGGVQCGALEELCGCSGEMVVTGCGFADGFASGPVRGPYSLSCGTKDGGADAAADASRR
ncbi:MAG TPA: hypothetical protein VHE30_21875 [Polyangiaceae bacterium]|nr:hypothetical protein [Polyangiaceae bacterium]